MGLFVKPLASSASRMARTRPSIMSEGATMSAPASTWDRAVFASSPRVLSLSTSWPHKTPQCPWEVYSHMQTSVITYISGCSTFARFTARWTMPSAA